MVGDLGAVGDVLEARRGTQSFSKAVVRNGAGAWMQDAGVMRSHVHCAWRVGCKVHVSLSINMRHIDVAAISLRGPQDSNASTSNSC